MAINIFIDGPQGAPPRVQELWEELGCMAWSVVASMEAAERDHEDDLWWDKNGPLKPNYDEDDIAIDLGPDEPDTYGSDFPETQNIFSD